MLRRHCVCVCVCVGACVHVCKNFQKCGLVCPSFASAQGPTERMANGINELIRAAAARGIVMGRVCDMHVYVCIHACDDCMYGCMCVCVCVCARARSSSTTSHFPQLVAHCPAPQPRTGPHATWSRFSWSKMYSPVSNWIHPCVSVSTARNDAGVKHISRLPRRIGKPPRSSEVALPVVCVCVVVVCW